MTKKEQAEELKKAQAEALKKEQAKKAQAEKLKKKQAEQPRLLFPDQMYRPHEARHFFGYKPTQLDEKIKAGEIPPPIPLSDSGRAVGWLGRQIIEWQQQRIAKRNAEAA